MSSKRFLYIDTTHSLLIGLMDESYKFVEHVKILEGKSGSVVHDQINMLLSKYEIELSSLCAIFVNNGPGSYTGVRVGEGIAKIYELDGGKVISFHEHEAIQSLANSGIWVANAFKGEFFIHKWTDNSKSETRLVKQDFFESDSSLDIYTNDDLLFDFNNTVHNSKDFLLKKSEIIFAKMYREELRRDTFYFRKSDEEFVIKK